jgi:DNA-directed RNA polymerase subunit RPC12/RpoP
MTTNKYRLVIPLPPVGLNQFYQKGWVATASLKKKWTTALIDLINQASIPRDNKKIEVVISYFFTTSSKHDKDNYTPKLFMDAFVKTGVIPDDTPEFLEWELACRKDGSLGFVSDVKDEVFRFEYVCSACGKKGKLTKKAGPACPCGSYTFQANKVKRTTRVSRVELEVTIIE